jgi:hypothetical protein
MEYKIPIATKKTFKIFFVVNAGIVNPFPYKVYSWLTKIDSQEKANGSPRSPFIAVYYFNR